MQLRRQVGRQVSKRACRCAPSVAAWCSAEIVSAAAQAGPDRVRRAGSSGASAARRCQEQPTTKRRTIQGNLHAGSGRLTQEPRPHSLRAIRALTELTRTVHEQLQAEVPQAGTGATMPNTSLKLSLAGLLPCHSTASAHISAGLSHGHIMAVIVASTQAMRQSAMMQPVCEQPARH